MLYPDSIASRDMALPACNANQLATGNQTMTQINASLLNNVFATTQELVANTAILWSQVSSNEKTGPIPVSTTAMRSCPSSCIFWDAGCYAWNWPMVSMWRNVSEAGPNSSAKNGKSMLPTIGWDELCQFVAKLFDGQLWRHNQAGDLPHIAQHIDSKLVAQLVEANRGKRGFTYTHHDMTLGNNAAIVKYANDNGFTINLSGNNLQHADMLANMGIGPVVSVVSMEYQRKAKKTGHGMEWIESLAEYKERMQTLPQTTPEGRAAVICPATYLDKKTCANCQLCQRQRESVVVFPAHGARQKLTSKLSTDSNAGVAA
jgi:ferredoxin